jgi:hypothetical protein
MRDPGAPMRIACLVRGAPYGAHQQLLVGDCPMRRESALDEPISVLSLVVHQPSCLAHWPLPAIVISRRFRFERVPDAARLQMTSSIPVRTVSRLEQRERAKVAAVGKQKIECEESHGFAALASGAPAHRSEVREPF